MADARTTMQTDGAEVSYEVDADAVAAAIIARLIAGGTIHPPGER